MSETSYLTETLNRRAKSLAHLRPLFDLEANKGRYPELPLAKLDLFRFASALLDVIVTEMGDSIAARRTNRFSLRSRRNYARQCRILMR